MVLIKHVEIVILLKGKCEKSSESGKIQDESVFSLILAHAEIKSELMWHVGTSWNTCKRQWNSTTACCHHQNHMQEAISGDWSMWINRKLKFSACRRLWILQISAIISVSFNLQEAVMGFWVFMLCMVLLIPVIMINVKTAVNNRYVLLLFRPLPNLMAAIPMWR